VTDTDEAQLPGAQAGAVAALKQQLPGLLPPHVLTDAKKAQLIREVTSIVGQTRKRQWLRVLLYPAVFGLLSVLPFAVLILLYLNFPNLGERLSDATASAIKFAIVTAILVGFIPLLTYFSDTVEVLLGWKGRWSRWNRISYATRLTVVPILSGFNGSLVLFLAALGERGLVSTRPWDVATFGPPLFILAVVVAAITNVGLLGPCLEEDEREWWASLTGLLMQYALAWLALFAILMYGIPGILRLVGGRTWLLGALTAAWAATSLGGAMSGHGMQSGLAGGGAIKTLVMKALRVLAPPVFLVGLLLLVAWLVHAVLSWLSGSVAGPTPYGSYWAGIWSAGLGATVACLGAGVAVLGLAMMLVDVNLFSLNAMYANRLIRCYLGASRRKPGWRARWGNDGPGWVRRAGGRPRASTRASWRGTRTSSRGSTSTTTSRCTTCGSRGMSNARRGRWSGRSTRARTRCSTRR
jgi:hypothetical protein